ncbi:hypothetical protein ACKVAX_21445 [Klebsiella pasteurii]|uniref:hypothetical protein n=1 Tax=Klebsiella pasteurii TaxID=2587529 RepID=UPI003F198E0B
MKVKTYSVNTFDAWLQTEGDDTAGSYVKFEDYAALAAECAALKSAIEFAEPWLPTCDEELLHRIEIAKQTPATDRIVAGIKADAAAPLVSALKVIANSEQISGETVVCDFDTLISVAACALRDYYAQQLREVAK